MKSMRGLCELKKLLTIGIIAVLFASLFMGLFPSSVATTNTIVKVSPAAQNIPVGQSFSINVVIDPHTPIAGAQFNLQFDPSLVQVNTVTEGKLFKQNGATTLFNPGIIDNNAGVVKHIWGNTLGAGESVSSVGTFAIIDFISTSSGLSPLELITVGAISVKVANPDGNAVPINIENGNVKVNALSPPLVTYGNGWKEVRYPDGSVTHTDGIRTYLRWDSEYRPWSGLDISSGDYPYLVEEFDNHYLLTKRKDSLTLQKSFGDYTFGVNKISFSFTATPQQLNTRSTYHNVNGVDYWYIPIPESILQTTKQFNWDNRLPQVFNESGNTTNPTNFGYHRVGGQLRFYYNQEARNFGAASSLLVFKFNSWVVGSGGNAWGGNVSFDDTREVQCTGKVELNQEVDDYISYWRMDKGTGNTAYDENETSNNDGSFTDGSTGNWTLSSKYGDYALDFDGGDDYVDCGDPVDGSLDFGTGAFTVAFWMKAATWNNWDAPISKALYDGGWTGFLFERSNTGVIGGISWVVGSDTIKSSTVLSTGNWYHVVGVRNTSEDTFIFINGNQEDTGSSTYNVSNSLDLQIGKNPDPTYPRNFDGIIDEVMIYNRALSNDEINQTRDNEHYSEGNLTSWHDAGSGNKTYKLSVNFTFPTNTNASINLYNNDTGAFIENLASHTTTANWDATITSPVQDSKVNITLYGNVTETPEIINVTYHTQTAPPVITLLSQTPSVLYQNSTGYMNITYGISHSSSGLNNTSVSFVYTVYNPIDDTYNHSLRVPSNNRSALESVTGEYILRADNRNDTPPLNFESNDTITRGNVYEWGGGDENTARLTIEPINSTYTLVHWNGTIRDTASIDSWYLNRKEQENATMTNLDIHKSSRPCIKIWDLEAIYGHNDYLFNFYLDTDFSGATPDKPILLYYLNSSYNPEGSVNPEDSPYGFFVTEHNATTWIDYLYELRNSSYIKAFSVNQSAIVDAGVETTNTGWVCFNTETSQSKPYSLNMTNDPTSTNRTFGECNVTWVGDNAPLSENLYTINAFGSDRHRGHQFKHQLYIADNIGTWANSTINTTDIEKAYFPPTKPSIVYFYYQDEKDLETNHTYSGTFDIGIAPASDPDDGDVAHNLTLHYGNRTFIAVINNTFNDTMRDNTFINISFDSSSHYSEVDNFTLQVNATDDEGVSIITWLDVNFTLNPPTLTIGNEQSIKEDWGQEFSSNFSANVTGQNAKEVWMNFSHNNFTNTSLEWLNISANEWVNQSHNVGSPITNVSVNITLNSTTADTTNGTASFYYEITKRNNTATMDSAGTQSVGTDVDFFINASLIEEHSDTFYGAADLLEDGAIILTNSSVIDYVNFTHNESIGGVYNYTIRFYNLTHYNNVTTPTYSNVTVSVADFIPPDPINLQNEISASGFWIKHTWEAGAGNISNSYNVSVNGTDHNGTTNLYFNNTGLSAHSWSNITVFAYNSSGNGSLSSGSVSENVQLPNNPVSVTNCSDRGAIETQTVYVDIDSSDADGDTPTFSCNRTDLFTDFSTSTGKGNWTTTTLDNGTYYIDFGVSDGYGSTDNCTMTITIAEGTPTAPTNLQYSLSSANQTIEWAWSNGQNTNSIDAILNGSAIGTITSPHQYTNSTLPRWENMSIRGYNSTTSEYSTWTNDTAYIEVPPGTYNISGYVKNETGVLIENVSIVNNITADTDYTNASGFYNLTGLLNNTYLVTASKAGYVSNSTAVTINGANMTNQNITLTETVGAANITSWWNNYTKDNLTSFVVGYLEEDNRTIFFNVTADQNITNWCWYKDNVLVQNSSSDNYTATWDFWGTYTVKVYGENANGQTSILTWNVKIQETLYELNLLLLEEEKMMGLSLLLGILIVIGMIFFLVGIYVPNSILTLLGSITFFITMALPIPMLSAYPYFGIALTSILLLFGVIALIITFYQWFTNYSQNKSYQKWNNYFE